MTAPDMSSTVATTKDRILDAAKGLMLAKSFHSVGLNEILAAVKVPKGSFYHYFTSKEQFGVELLRYYLREATACKRRSLLSPELESNALERLCAFLQGGIAHFVEQDCRCGCLVMKLSTEVAGMSDDMRQALAEGMREWCAIYEQVISEGQKQRVIRKDRDPSAAAQFVNDYWMGAMQRMLVERTVAPLKAAALIVRDYLER